MTSSFDWNALIQTVAVALVPIIVAAFGAWLRSHMNDQVAVAAISQALTNGLGAMQQAIQNGATAGAAKQVGVAYVKAVVPDALAREPAANTDALIGERLEARVGVENVKANLATAASPLPSPAPLAPVPPVLPPPLGRVTTGLQGKST